MCVSVCECVHNIVQVAIISPLNHQFGSHSCDNVQKLFLFYKCLARMNLIYVAYVYVCVWLKDPNGVCIDFVFTLKYT